MKNLFLFIVFILFNCLIINAQPDTGEATITTQFGINFSNFKSDESFDNNIRPAFNIGFICDHYFSDRWSFSSGIIYDSKGAKTNHLGENYYYRLNYITMPMLANLHFGSNRNWVVNFGAIMGIIYSAKAVLPTGKIDILDVIDSSFDAGVALGVGYKFDIADDKQFYVQYQGYNGFINILDLDFSVYNMTSALNLGIVFKI